MKKLFLSVLLFSTALCVSAVPLSEQDKKDSIKQFTAFQTALKKKDFNALYDKLDPEVYRNLIDHDQLGKAKASKAGLPLSEAVRHKAEVFGMLSHLRVFRPNPGKPGFNVYKGRQGVCNTETQSVFVKSTDKDKMMGGEPYGFDGLRLIYSEFPGKRATDEAVDECVYSATYYFQLQNHKLKLLRVLELP